MRTAQVVVKRVADLEAKVQGLQALDPNVVLVFGSVGHFKAAGFAETLRAALPNAVLIGCSTAGEITADGVDDDTCTLTGVRFEQTQIRVATTKLAGMDDSRAAGMRLGEQLQAADVQAVLVFGPGLAINGSALAGGMASVLGTCPISGGLAGDAGAFAQTFTLGPLGVADDAIVAVGLYGQQLTVANASFGGWEPFGLARKVTRCEGNVLFELDGEPALEVYKRYLGDHARDLPASGLLFPLAMFDSAQDATGLIRTILAVDEVAGSLTLAGEVFNNGFLKLMHASTDKLVAGAEAAAQAVGQSAGDGLALLVSCVGRKLVMGGRVDEEVEAVSDYFGRKTLLTGFYSYGEINPFGQGGECKLHNQTMTITWLGEAQA